MHIIDGIVNGDLSVREDSELRGMVNGSVTVLAGHLVLRGMLHGELRVCAGASAEVLGMVSTSAQPTKATVRPRTST